MPRGVYERTEKIRLSLSKTRLEKPTRYWLGRSFSEEHKRKLSESRKGKTTWMKGKHHSEKTKQKISETKKANPIKTGFKKGHEHTSETIKIISKTWFKKGHKLVQGKKHPMYGKHHTKEAKQKISQKNKGNPGHWTGKKHPELTKQKMRQARKKQILPLKDTLPERITQIALSLENIPYKKHIAFPMPWGFHQVDILIEPNIAIEVDGCYWHGCVECGHANPKKTKKDKRVTSELQKQGLTVLRFWEHSIKSDIDSVIQKIKNSNLPFIDS